MNAPIKTFDRKVINFFTIIALPLARVALFVVFFWFGFLKIIDASPANPLVSQLLERTLPFISFDRFIIFFSIYEMLIGILFLIPGVERAAVALLVPHMIMTALPLALLPMVTWNGFFVPTLEGQYIIKNLVIIALAVNIVAHSTPYVPDRK